jgi:hypothetical protein
VWQNRFAFAARGTLCVVDTRNSQYHVTALGRGPEAPSKAAGTSNSWRQRRSSIDRRRPSAAARLDHGGKPMEIVEGARRVVTSPVCHPTRRRSLNTCGETRYLNPPPDPPFFCSTRGNRPRSRSDRRHRVGRRQFN